MILIRKLGYKILKFFVPELHNLKRDINWKNLESFKNHSTIDNKARIIERYNIQFSAIGGYSYVSENSYISNTEIGKFCSIGPNLICGWGIHPTNGISTSPMFYSTKKQNGVTWSKEDKIKERKPIKIGNDVFIGINVTILDGVNIGDGAVIGAGAVVSKDIPPYAIAVGSPIKIIKYRFEVKQIEKLLKIKWWNFDKEQLQDVEKMFFDVDAFIKKYDA
jgi:acetyltransferase-like isoleucine patch superfamily enzyme